MTSIQSAIDPTTLLRTRKGAVDIIDVPELGFAVVDGTGAPEGSQFAEALQALFAVSYAAHFQVKRLSGATTKLMPLESLWWVEEVGLRDAVKDVARGQQSMASTDRDQWRWQAMIIQPAPIDATTIDAVVDELREQKHLPGLDRLRYERWAEGRCAQVLHVGPYGDEGPSIVRLHEGIAAAGYRPHGRHHEIYLGDPRHAAPEKLRTLLRQPVKPF